MAKNKPESEEEPVVHTILDIFHNGRRFYCELKDLDGISLLMINEQTVPALLKAMTRHVIAHQSHETTVEMIDKAEVEETIEYNIGNKKCDCINYDKESDCCKLYSTEDPVCYDDAGICEEYVKQDGKN